MKTLITKNKRDRFSGVKQETRSSKRLASIDVFRAITMFLMIFVNDLWTLQEIPGWLGHKAAGVDGMGLADTIFPAFLFIVGLSIPFAIRNRLRKGQSKHEIFKHILIRSLALLIMGVFHVNLENYSDNALLPKPVWQILITICFFLIWLDYSKRKNTKRTRMYHVAGILLLMFLALIYQGDSVSGYIQMRPQWWGILGLIGWAYLICSSLYLYASKEFPVIISGLVFFIFFNSATQLDWLGFLDEIKPYIWLISDGAMPTFTMAGVLTAVVYRNLKNKSNILWVSLAAISFILLIYGFVTRPLWGISKLGATPSWTTICSGLSVICFGLLIILVDRNGKEEWFNIIKPAGTSTLTCYLLPYYHYALYSIIGISLPFFLRTGTAGIGKSLLYALIIILITGWLEKL